MGRLSRSGRVRGPQPGRRAPLHYVVDVGPRDAGGDSGQGQCAAAGHKTARVKKETKTGEPAAALIPLTVPEVRRVVARIVFAGRRDPQKVLAWLDWRRWDKQVAKENHDTTRGHPPLQL